MDAKRFENYQQRILNAISNPNKQSNDPFTKLSNILDNLKIFVEEKNFSQNAFKQEVNRQFASIDSSDETAQHFQKQLNTFCSSKSETLQTISDLYNMVKPLSQQVASWSSVANITKQCMAEIQGSIYNSK